MKCGKAMDMVYGDGQLLLREQAALAFHLLFCRSCAGALQRYDNARELLRTDFFPPSPDFEDPVMTKILAEEELFEREEDTAFYNTSGFSTRGWVIAGLAVTVSLAFSFFGRDFLSIAASHGSSFLLPLGIIMGIILSAYGSLFIGSHLKELSQRFHLRHP
jgi:hypothetical protein